MKKSRFFKISIFALIAALLIVAVLPLTVMAGPGGKKNTSVHVHADFGKGVTITFTLKNGSTITCTTKNGNLWDGSDESKLVSTDFEKMTVKWVDNPPTVIPLPDLHVRIGVEANGSVNIWINGVAKPTPVPSTSPSTEPSTSPSAEPSTSPSAEPSTEPSAEPSAAPTESATAILTDPPVPLDPGESIAPSPSASASDEIELDDPDVPLDEGTTDDDDDSPKTGDESNLMFWLLALAATAGMTVLVIRWYRKANNN